MPTATSPISVLQQLRKQVKFNLVTWVFYKDIFIAIFLNARFTYAFKILWSPHVQETISEVLPTLPWQYKLDLNNL